MWENYGNPSVVFLKTSGTCLYHNFIDFVHVGTQLNGERDLCWSILLLVNACKTHVGEPGFVGGLGALAAQVAHGRRLPSRQCRRHRFDHLTKKSNRPSEKQFRRLASSQSRRSYWLKLFRVKQTNEVIYTVGSSLGTRYW